jgi:hypothetical protein
MWLTTKYQISSGLMQAIADKQQVFLSLDAPEAKLTLPAQRSPF